MASKYFEDVQIGEEVPVFERTTTLMHWNRYAAVNDEFHYVHMDDDAGRAAGQGAAFGMGNLRWAYALNALRGWAGDGGEVRELRLQFREVNHKNDHLRVLGRVISKNCEDGRGLVSLRIDVVNQKGESTAPGRAIVALPFKSP